MKLVDAAHPLGVAAGEVVVHGDDVHAAARERVQVHGSGAGQRLAFAGAHLGDAALVQEHAADELHVVVPLADGAPRTSRISAKASMRHVVECLAVGDLLLHASRRARKVLVVERAHLRFERVDARRPSARPSSARAVLRSDDALEDPINHAAFFLKPRANATKERHFDKGAASKPKRPTRSGKAPGARHSARRRNSSNTCPLQGERRASAHVSGKCGMRHPRLPCELQLSCSGLRHSPRPLRPEREPAQPRWLGVSQRRARPLVCHPAYGPLLFLKASCAPTALAVQSSHAEV
jgi:hypothetical protein